MFKNASGKDSEDEISKQLEKLAKIKQYVKNGGVIASLDDINAVTSPRKPTAVDKEDDDDKKPAAVDKEDNNDIPDELTVTEMPKAKTANQENEENHNDNSGEETESETLKIANSQDTEETNT